MSQFVAYYAAGMVLLLLALPLGFHAFPDCSDRGWASARFLGIAVAAVLHRLVESAGLAPWSTATLLLAGLPALTLWLLWAIAQRQALTLWLRSSWRTLVSLELVFLGSYLGAAVLTAHDPAPLGTERLMDFSLLQAVFSASSFPPIDSWLSGETLNYYWFGHLMAAIPGKLSGVPVPVLYNLALSYWFAMLVQLSCALLLRAAGSIRRSLLGGMLVGLAGSVYPWLHLRESTASPESLFAAARVIPHTITEFPAYSLLTGDLHAHVLLLPVVLLFLLWLRADRRTAAGLILTAVVLNLLLVVTVLGNPWSLAALLLLFAATWIMRCTAMPWWTPAPALVLLPLVWPVQGHGVSLGWVATTQASPLPAFLQMWGIPLLLLLGLLDKQALGTRLRHWGWLWLLPPLALALHAPAAGLSLALALLLWLCHQRGEAIWAAAGATGVLLLLLPELLYVKDTYVPPFERMNTVFKFSYAAWPLLMLGAARAALLPFPRLVLAPLLGALFIYAALAIPQRLRGDALQPWWDGLAALEREHAQDIALIRWLTPQLQPGDVCLEVPGVSYQWAGRVAALTGCPTVLGWESHEGLWRGGDIDLAGRHADVDSLYQGDDPEKQRQLLRRYGINWIIVGEEELRSYGVDRPAFWHGELHLVYSAGDNKIYRVGMP